MVGKTILTLGAIFIILAICRAERSDKKWVWGDNNREGERNGFGDNSKNYDRDEASSRYEVYENERPQLDRPINDNSGEYGGVINSRPIVPPRPFVPSRPGGIYPENNNIGGYGPGQGNYGPGQGNYGPGQGNYVPNREPPHGILTGPIPSWQQEGPYKEFNHCKCSERFNCNSPGLAYGNCDVGKQYCCYSTNKEDQIGGPPPSRPIHSLDNGILVGPGGPVDNVAGVNDYLRPGHRPGVAGFRPGNSFRPNGYQRPGGFGFGGRPRPDHFNGNIHSYENGVLVGPGGPFDGPNIEYANANRFPGRSANNKKN